MKTKKVISAVLAGACALSCMSLSAFAADKGNKTVTSSGETTFKVSAGVVSPTISVSIPSTISAVINPYGVAVSDKNGSYGANGVTSAEYTIRNFTTDSGVAVNVSAGLTVSTTKDENKNTVGTFKYVTGTAALADSVTDKSLSAWVEGKAVTANVAYTGDKKDQVNATEEDKLTLASGTTKVAFADTTVYDKEAATVEPTTGVLFKLAAATPEVTEGTPADPTYSFGKFQISGSATAMDVDGGWTSKDKVTLNLVLNIYPASVE